MPKDVHGQINGPSLGTANGMHSDFILMGNVYMSHSRQRGLYYLHLFYDSELDWFVTVELFIMNKLV